MPESSQVCAGNRLIVSARTISLSRSENVLSSRSEYASCNVLSRDSMCAINYKENSSRAYIVAEIISKSVLQLSSSAFHISVEGFPKWFRRGYRTACVLHQICR